MCATALARLRSLRKKRNEDRDIEAPEGMDEALLAKDRNRFHNSIVWDIMGRFLSKKRVALMDLTALQEFFEIVGHTVGFMTTTDK